MAKSLQRYLITYILKLEDDNWYVGLTMDFNRRMVEHFEQVNPSKWTKLHKPVKIHRIYIGDREDEMTLKMMKKYGVDNVRGGKFHAPELPPDLMPKVREAMLKKKIVTRFIKKFWTGL